MSELSARAKQILYTAVTEFVSTGNPVSSRTLAKRGVELSPATIRTVLVDLEDGGYLHQPHTSAGRVPTDRAFRLFIDALMELRELPREDRNRIEARFSDLQTGENVMRETGRLLSELADAAAVVVSPRRELTLRRLRFIRTLPGEVLAVLVMSNGVVQNRFLRVMCDDHELEKIHELLDDVIDGRTLGELKELFDRRLTEERVQRDTLRKRAFQLGSSAVTGVSEEQADVVIEGRARLLERPDLSGDGVREVMNALDAQERIVELLGATLAAGGTAVVVGREAGELGGGQLAIVGAQYKERGRPAGQVGVIGTTRMDYAKVMPIVSATAEAMTAFMDRQADRDRIEHAKSAENAAHIAASKGASSSSGSSEKEPRRGDE